MHAGHGSFQWRTGGASPDGIAVDDRRGAGPGYSARIHRVRWPVAAGQSQWAFVTDPQYCRGGPEAVAKVAEWMHPCQCSHSALMHDLVKRKTGQVRTACSVTERETKCPCTLYARAPALD